MSPAIESVPSTIESGSPAIKRPIVGFGNRSRLRIGLLGGSFNPAHKGHLYIANQALKRLGLDQVWFLVSPQNPLKSPKGMAPLSERLTSCAKIVGQNPNIRITALETRLRTQYTAHTVSALKMRYPAMDFVWIMGADNLAAFHLWHQGDRIFKTCRIAIFHRPAYSIRALSSQTAHRYTRSRRCHGTARRLMQSSLPAWMFLPIRGMAISATQIRNDQIRTVRNQQKD